MNINVMWRGGTHIYIYIHIHLHYYMHGHLYILYLDLIHLYTSSLVNVFFAYTLHPHLLALVTRSLGHGRHEKLPA